MAGDGQDPQIKRPRLLDDSVDDADDIMKQYAAPPTEPKELLPLAVGVLDGCGPVAVSRCFSEEDRAIATRVVRENGGTITSPLSAKYLLAPLEGAWSQLGGAKLELEEIEGAVVTMIWLVCWGCG